MTDEFVDKDRFSIYIVTIWGNTVVAPEHADLHENDLEHLHDYRDAEIKQVLGAEHSITSCYEYLSSKVGEDAMNRLQIAADHRVFIRYFAQLILGADPSSHLNLPE